MTCAEIDATTATSTAAERLAVQVRYPGGETETLALPAGKVTVGAGPRCTVRLRHPGVRPLHCLIAPSDEGLRVRRWSEDTVLNGDSFSDARLEPGDRLQLGPVELELLLQVSQTPAPPNPFVTVVKSEASVNGQGIGNLPQIDQSLTKLEDKLAVALAEEGSPKDAELDWNPPSQTTNAAELFEQTARVKGLETELRQLKFELADTQLLYANAQDAAVELKRQLAETAQQQPESAPSDTAVLNNWNAERAAWNTERSEWNQQRSEWTQERTAYNLQTELLQSEVARLTHQIAELQTERDRLQDELTAGNTRLGQLERALVELEHSLESATAPRPEAPAVVAEPAAAVEPVRDVLCLPKKADTLTVDFAPPAAVAEPPIETEAEAVEEPAPAWDLPAVEAEAAAGATLMNFGGLKTESTPATPAESALGWSAEAAPASPAVANDPWALAAGKVEQTPEPTTAAATEASSFSWPDFVATPKAEPSAPREEVALETDVVRTGSAWDIESPAVSFWNKPSEPAASEPAPEPAVELALQSAFAPPAAAPVAAPVEEPIEEIWSRLPLKEEAPAEPPSLYQSLAIDSAVPVVEEVVEAPKAEAESFLERFKHILPADEPEPAVPAVEEANRSAYDPFAPRNRQAAPTVPEEVAPTPMPHAAQVPGGHDDDSIENYMARLMQRVRGDGDPAAAAIVPVARPVAPLLEEEVQPILAPVPSAQPLADLSEIKGGRAREQVTNMSALRELANQNARGAIKVAHHRRNQQSASTNVALAGLGLACSIVMAITAPEGLSLQFLASLVPLVGAGYFGCRTAIQFLRVSRGEVDHTVQHAAPEQTIAADQL